MPNPPIDVGGVQSEILVGSVALYTSPAGVALPNMDGTLPIVWPAPTTSPVADGWTKVGYTEAGVDLDYAPTFKPIYVDEELAEVRQILEREKATVVTKLAQATLDKLNLAISASGITKVVADATHAAITKFVTGSGIQAEMQVGFQGYSPEALATNPNLPLPRLFVGYRAIAMGTVKSTHKRADKVMLDLSFQLLADSTKAVGERLYKIVDHTAPHT